MDLLLFSGNNVHNKDWIMQVAIELQPLFDTCKVHNYKHWQTGQESIDLSGELISLSRETGNLNNYIIFGKSIGTILASKGIYEDILQPKKCIFLGLPMLYINKNKDAFGGYLKSINQPILFIQNQHDPFGSAEEVKNYLANLGLINYRLVVLKGDTHDYKDFAKLLELAKIFIKSKVKI